MATQMCTEIFATISAAALVDQQYLFTAVMSAFPIGLALWVTLFMIPAESDNDKKTTTDVDVVEEEIVLTFGESIRKSLHLMSQILRDGNVLLLLATVPIAFLRQSISELWLQYIPKKFGLSLGSVRLSIPLLTPIH